MTSCAASLTASSLSPSSGSGAGAGADARAADSGAATRWAAHLPSSPGEHRAHEPHHGRLGGERLHRAVPPLDLAVRALLHVVRPDLLPVLAGEGHEGERVLPRALEDVAGRAGEARSLGAARSHAARATSPPACPAHARTRSAASAWPARLWMWLLASI